MITLAVAPVLAPTTVVLLTPEDRPVSRANAPASHLA